jgi:hypothetical protein
MLAYSEQVSVLDKQTIRDRLRAATLPGISKAFVYVDRGNGNLCGCCDLLVDRQVSCLFVDSGGKVVVMHPDCFNAWHAEASELRVETGGEKDASAPTAVGLIARAGS